MFDKRRSEYELYDKTKSLGKGCLWGIEFLSITGGNYVRCVLQAMKMFYWRIGWWWWQRAGRQLNMKTKCCQASGGVRSYNSNNNDIGEISSEDMSNLYPVIWQNFIWDSGESDDIKVIVNSGS